MFIRYISLGNELLTIILLKIYIFEKYCTYILVLHTTPFIFPEAPQISLLKIIFKMISGPKLLNHISALKKI